MYKGIVNESSSIDVEVKNGKIVLDGQSVDFDILPLSSSRFHVLHEQNSYRIEVQEAHPDQKKYVITVNGKPITVQIKEEIDTLLETMGMDSASESDVKEIRSPMPGLIRAIAVAEGSEVKSGDNLLTLEAMKMENSIKSPVDGVIASLHVTPEQSVEKNQVLLTFE